MIISRFAAIGLVLSLIAGSANAEVQAMGRYRDWRVFVEQVNGDLICFAAVEAEDSAPKNLDHGDVNFYVANWKSGAANDQPSLKVGYSLRTDLAPLAIVGRERFRMYAVGVEAFVEDSRERALVDALKRGTELRIEAAEAGSHTAYHFSLRGSRDAIEKARSLCR